MQIEVVLPSRMGDINGEERILNSRGWSRMIEDTVQCQGFGGIMERARGQASACCEIEEVEAENNGQGLAGNADNPPEETYVAVGRDSNSGLSALHWALQNSVEPGGSVTLIHVFQAARLIPTPVGKLPRSQVTEDMVGNYIKDEEKKRKKLLQKYMHICSNAKVKAETIIIEGEVVEKAIVDLISVLNITKLIIGTRSANHAMTWKLKLGPGKAGYIQRNAPHFCKVLVIFEGQIVPLKEESEANNGGSSRTSSIDSRHIIEEQKTKFSYCTFFWRKFILPNQIVN